MFTRNDYIEGKCDHRAYYAQFVTETTKDIVRSHIGVEALQKASDKKNLNGIPLAVWDSMHLPLGTINKLKEVGDGFSMAGQVCIFKEAARQIIEENAV